jgi:hypothetical protein
MSGDRQTINQRMAEINRQVSDLVAESEHLMYLHRMGVDYVDGKIPDNVAIGPWEGSSTRCER